MKLLHLGDLHLGKSLCGYDLKQDQEFILDQIIDIIRDREVEGVLISGDVYDSRKPSDTAVRLLDQFLVKLTQTGVDIYMISGNHDSSDRLNYGSDLFQMNKIYIVAEYGGTLYKVTKTDEFGEVDIYLLPFVKASTVRSHHEDTIEDYEDAVRAVLAHAEVDPNRRNVILAHQYVVGSGGDPVHGGSEGVDRDNVGTVEKIGYRVFDDFDYVALGHIHSPQEIGRAGIRYAGSPLKYSLSEAEHVKSVPIITLGEKGEVDIQLIPLRPMRDLRHLVGRLDVLLDRDNIENTEDFIYATLTDDVTTENVMGVFRGVYPNTLAVNYAEREYDRVDHLEVGEDAAQKPFDELIKEFYQLMYDEEISDDELEFMQLIAGEAGVIDETN